MGNASTPWMSGHCAGLRPCSARPPRRHATHLADELGEREQALRSLPLPYSLALRLRDAGVADEMICLYVNVERAALDGFYRIAEAKLVAAQEASLHRLGHRDVSFEAQ